MRDDDPRDEGAAEQPGGGGEAGRVGHGAPRPRRRLSGWREVVVLVVVALVVALVVKTFVVQAFFIPSGSMEQTLAIGDRVAVEKLSYRFREPRRGEIVVFNGVDSFTPEVTQPQPSGGLGGLLHAIAASVGLVPPDERDFVKRVIGLPGDRVRCCDSRGRVTVNGVALDEAGYLYPGNAPSTMTFDVRVPPGKLWVMGDHRAISQDSRAHLGQPGGGMVPVDRVVGRAMAIVWPVRHWTGLGVPATYARPALRSSSAVGSAALGVLVVPVVPAVLLDIAVPRGRRRRRRRTVPA